MFDWHPHEQEDELSLALRTPRSPSRKVRQCTVPPGVEHQPHAEDEVHVLSFEPASTVNTGSRRNARTRLSLEHL